MTYQIEETILGGILILTIKTSRHTKRYIQGKIHSKRKQRRRQTINDSYLEKSSIKKQHTTNFSSFPRPRNMESRFSLRSHPMILYGKINIYKTKHLFLIRDRCLTQPTETSE